MVNCNEETNIPFGIISSNQLNPELVDDLMYVEGFNMTEADALVMAVQEYRFSKEDIALFRNYKGIDLEYIRWTGNTGEDYMLACQIISELENDDAGLDMITENLMVEEPYIVGEYEGIHYQTSWIGGALNFVIISSPYITKKANRGSPCVPNMGVLDTLDGDYQCYDVPADWRWTEDD